MSIEKFDHIIKEQLQQLNFEPTTSGFDAIMQKLDAINNTLIIEQQEQANKKLAFGWFNTKTMFRAAAIILPIVALWGTYKMFSNKPIQTNTAANVVTQQTTTTNANSNANTSASNNVAATNNTTLTNNSPTNNNTAVTNYNIAVPSKFIKPNNTPINLENNFTYNNNTRLNTNVPNANIPNATNANNSINNNTATTIANNGTTTNGNTAVANNNKPAPKVNPYIDAQQDNPYKRANTPNKSVVFSVTGGALINARTTNGSNFNLGINVQKPITNKVYIEASIAASRNNPSWLQNAIASNNTTVNNGGNASLVGYSLDELNRNNTNGVNALGIDPTAQAFRAGGNNIDTRELVTDQEIANAAAYRLASTQVEFKPMIGYKVTKKINIAGGADAAKIFADKNFTAGVDHLMLLTTAAPTMRTWDVGLNANIEYFVTKNIALGYRHREGLTNMTPGVPVATRRNYNGVTVRVKVK